MQKRTWPISSLIACAPKPALKLLCKTAAASVRILSKARLRIDVLKVQPLKYLVLVDVTGAQLMELLDYAATIQPGNGAFLQVAGLTWTLNRPTGKADNVQVGGQPINLERTYKVVTNNFMGAGGDGYSVLKDLPKIDTGYVDADSLREYIAQKGKVGAAVEGRLTIVE